MARKGTKIQRDRDHLTTGEAAKICSVTPDTVLKWIKRNKLRAFRTAGGHFRIARDDLASLLDEQHPEAQQQRHPEFCWEFNSCSEEPPADCLKCAVYQTRAYRCYEMAKLPVEHAKLYCQESCETCAYYISVHALSPGDR